MAHTVEKKVQLPSSFDAHHPPEKENIDDCVHCGFCLPACPTYVLWGEEMDSPRGRIYMIKKAAEGEAPLDDRFRQHMDRCLGCMACMTACPSGVEYNKLIEPTRAQIERNMPRSLGENVFRKLIFATFPHPGRLRLLALPLLVYQKSGLRTLTRALGISKLLPKRLAARHAVDNCARILVFKEGRSATAKVVALSSNFDIALIGISRTPGACGGVPARSLRRTKR